MLEEMKETIISVQFKQNEDQTFTSTRIPCFASPDLIAALEKTCCTFSWAVDTLRLLGAEETQTLLRGSSGAIKRLAATEYPASFDRVSRTLTISHSPGMKLGFDVSGEAEIALTPWGVMLYACGKPYPY